MTDRPQPSVEEFTAEARAWLDANAARRPETQAEQAWGTGEFSVAVFHALTADEERALLERLKAWNQLKATKATTPSTGPWSWAGSA